MDEDMLDFLFPESYSDSDGNDEIAIHDSSGFSGYAKLSAHKIEGHHTSYGFQFTRHYDNNDDDEEDDE